MYKHTVKFILPGFRPISHLVKEFVEIDFEGEFKAIIDLQGGVRIVPTTLRGRE